MKRAALSLLIVMAMVITLLAGCSASSGLNQGDGETTVTQSVTENLNHDDTTVGTDTGVEQNTTDGTESPDVDEASAVIVDAFGEKEIEITYHAQHCEVQGNDGYFLSIVTKAEADVFDIEFFADYTADQYYTEQVAAFASFGLEASNLENYVNEVNVFGFEFVESESGAKYSFQLLVEVDGGLLVVHNPDLDVAHDEYAKNFAEKVFVSAKLTETGDNVEAEDTSTGSKIALTNEDKENVYKADYEAIKDRIAEEVKDGSEVSYLDADGREIMYVYYDGDRIADVFFYRYNDNGVKESSRVYAFEENGEYDIMEFEYHENGEVKSEIVYNDDGGKMVISFDESGNYVSITEYDKDGNLVE